MTGPSDPSFQYPYNGFFITIEHSDPKFVNPSKGGDNWNITSAGMLTSSKVKGTGTAGDNQINALSAEIDGSLRKSLGAFSGNNSKLYPWGNVKLFAHLDDGTKFDITSGDGGQSVG